MGGGGYPSIVDCIELGLSLWSIVRTGWSLSRLNDWKSLAYVTTEKSVISMKSGILVKNYKRV